MITALDPRYAFGGREGPSLLALVGDAPVRLDLAGVRAAFGEKERTDETCLAGARLLLADEPLPARELPPRPLSALLARVCDRLPRGRVALALSGGVDSAVLAALLRGRVTAFTLDAKLAGYGEGDEAAALALHLGVHVKRVEAHGVDFVAALPEAVRLAETPLYNLHPVARLLLAKRVRAEGFDALVTGDGADEVFRGEPGGDYLPVVGALMRGAGLRAFAPFLDPEVAAGVARDPAKGVLRTSAVELGVPPEVAWREKSPRYTPTLDVERYLDRPLARRLARALGRELTLETDRDRVRFATLGLFARLVPGLEDACAE